MHWKAEIPKFIPAKAKNPSRLRTLRSLTGWTRFQKLPPSWCYYQNSGDMC